MTSAGLMALLLTYRYWLIFPLAIIEGPILAMICGFLMRAGIFELVPTFIIFFLADLLGDAGWYWLGRRYGRGFIARWGKYLSITEEHVNTMERVFQRYHARILLFSKLTMGLGFPGVVLFTAGVARIRFASFMALNAAAQLVWTSFLLAIGYYLGQLYEIVSGALGLASSLALMALVLGTLFGFSRYLRAEITKRAQQ